MENRLYAYADESTLLAVVRKPADIPAVASSLNRDLARIHECCNSWCMILNPNNTCALVVSRSRTVNSPHGDLVLSGVPIWLVPTSKFLVWSLTASSPSNTMCVELSLVSRKELVFWGWWSASLLLLCIWSPNPWVLFSDLEVCCWMLSSASRVPGVFGGQALPGLEFLVVVSSTSCCCTLHVVQG